MIIYGSPTGTEFAALIMEYFTADKEVRTKEL